MSNASNIRLFGLGVSPGRVSGPTVRVTGEMTEPASVPAPEDPHAEAGRIGAVARRVAAHLEGMAEHATGDVATILTTTAALAGDPELVSHAEQLVTAQRIPAARAVYEAANSFAHALVGAGGYLAERVRDIEDVRDRIIAELLDMAPPGVPELETPSVLVARDFAPVDTAALDPAKVLALVTEEGGPTSHTAILARSLGIPAVVALPGVLEREMAAVVVDGTTGMVESVPSDAPVMTTGMDTQITWNGVGATADGHVVGILANVGAPADARAAVTAGAEGVGLFRTEFCYLDVDGEPTVDQQRVAYAAVLEPFQGKQVVVRTLDAGVDKALSFLAPETETNPALGARGLRVALEHPDVLDRQLEAIAGAAVDTGADVSVMAPMVATAEEAAWFAERALAAGLVSAGVMIEVPASAMNAREILDAVDFVSVGTNDLAQYTFAADRQVGAVAALNDPWQPGLLRLVSQVTAAGKATGKPVGVCGEAAADPLLAPVLVGLGISSLSMNTGSIRAVGAGVAAARLPECQHAAAEVLEVSTPQAARSCARAHVLG